MAFWNETNTEPKRNFRFQVQFGGVANKFGASDSTLWWAKKITKPNFTITEGKHVYLGHTFYYPGKVEWQEISMTLVDPVSPNAGAIFMDMVAKSGYKLPTDSTKKETLAKRDFSDATNGLGVCTIIQLDSEGNNIETWTLNNPFIKSLKFGDLDYENDDLSNIEVGLRYDWAECNTANADFFKA